MGRLACPVAVYFCTALVMAACAKREERAPAIPDAKTPDVAESRPPAPLPPSASVQLRPTQGNRAHGSLVVSVEPAAVRLTGAIQDLPPASAFGFHIHENGDCSAPDASSAGNHFNPKELQHGHPGDSLHHAGDIENIKSNAAGVAQVNALVIDVSLHDGQPIGVLGKAVVVHAKPDDYSTQPSGNSGARIACGVISMESLAPADQPAPRSP